MNFKVKKTGNERYDDNLELLYRHFHEKEKIRRSNAGEKWNYQGGRTWVLSKVFYFLSMFFALILTLGNTLVLDAQITQGYQDNISQLKISSAALLVLCGLLFASGIIMVFKKHKTAIVSSILICLLIAIVVISLFGGIPDTTTYKDGYVLTFSLFLIPHGVVVITSMILFFILRNDRNELKNDVNFTLARLAKEKGENRLLSLDEYSRLIDEYFQELDIKLERKRKKTHK